MGTLSIHQRVMETFFSTVVKFANGGTLSSVECYLRGLEAVSEMLADTPHDMADTVEVFLCNMVMSNDDLSTADKKRILANELREVAVRCGYDTMYRDQ